MQETQQAMRGPLELDEMVDELRRIVRDSIRRTSMCSHVTQLGASVGGGKMLRGRLVLRIGSAANVARPTLCRAAAAVEMLHGASLLHDDIVDGGTQRRGAPAFWVSHGTRAAVLLGDLLVSLAAEEIHQSMPLRLPMLITALREMCDAETEQEFAAAETDASWDRCVDIARRKTGSLFAFAAACAGGNQPARVRALHRAGYALGTAYQLADDLLDACPTPPVVDKSLGTDLATGKLTAASALIPDGVDPEAAIVSLLRASEKELERWPDVVQAWREYLNDFIAPLIAQFTGSTTTEVLA